MNKTTIARLLGTALLASAAQAQADITWTFDSAPNSGYTTVDSTSVKQTAGGVTTTAQGWSNTNNGTAGTSNAALGTTTLSNSGSYKLETAYLSVYDGGIGTKNRDASSSSSSYGDNSESSSPEHAVDNNQRYDSVLFSFDSAVDLNKVSLGYWNNDSDISVLRYDADDGAASTTSIAGKTYADLLTSGWNLVSYTDADSGYTKNLTGDTFSSYWLIGAANPLLGTANTDGKDHVKILALAGGKYAPPPPPPPGVPEPGTLLLMGAGLFGLTRIRARRVVRGVA